MIVIVIIGVVYTLAIQNISKVTQKVSSLHLENLKEYLISLEYKQSASILCLDDCSQCGIYIDGNQIETLENFIDDTIKVYRYDFLYGYIEKEAEVYFNDRDVSEDVCFSYTVDKERVGDQVVVEYKENVYDLSSYFTHTLKYKSLEDVAAYKLDLLSELSQ